LEMFKKAGSPEEFERMINTENNSVNNLDLNGDGDIDYIRVIDKRDGDNHAFVLQDAVSETESQDIAVVEVERKGNQNVVLQIVGDEDIYGEQLIVEPQSAQSTQPSPSNQPAAAVAAAPTVVNVWGWPSVQYIYGPTYTVWASPWGWGGWPMWWHPWRPWGWHRFYTYGSPYRPYYRVVNYHRVVYAHRMYSPMRSTSVIVRTRTGPAVTHYRYSQSAYRPASSHYVNRTRTTTSYGTHGRTRPTTSYQGTNGRTRTTSYQSTNGRTRTITYQGTNGRTRTTTSQGSNGRTRTPSYHSSSPTQTPAVHGTNGRTRTTSVHGNPGGRTHASTPHGTSGGHSHSSRASSHH
jgi:hypothetical protein